MNMGNILMAKTFKLNYTTPTNNNHEFHQTLKCGYQNGIMQYRIVVIQYVQISSESVVSENVVNQNGQNYMVLQLQEGLGHPPLFGQELRTSGPKERMQLISRLNLEEIEEVKANCILMANLQQAATSGTQLDNAFRQDSTDQLSGPPSQVPQKVDETNDLSKPVTSNTVPTPQESKIVKHDNVIAPGMFRINPFKPSREEKFVPNKVRASVRTNPITVSQPHVVTKKDVNSDSNGLSSTGVDNTAKTRRPQPRSNTKNDRVPSCDSEYFNKIKHYEVEEHHRIYCFLRIRNI
ncbi:hypothetical protein Tco_1449291 [Tanacetum coccineum]